MALALVGLCLTAGAAQAASYRAEIRRTTAGIPHIRALDEGSLGFGYGYAFAQDNVCALAEAIVTVNAQRSRFFGPDGSYGETNVVNNLKSDFFFQSIKDARTVERLVRRPPPLGPSREVRDLVRGYVAGYNHYLRRTGRDRIPDERCRGAPWVRPIRKIDLYRRFHQLGIRASSGNFIHAIVDASPPRPGAAGRRPPGGRGREIGSNQNAEPVRRDDLGFGNSTYGLGRGATDNGRGMVLSNHYLAWDRFSRLYEVQLTIPGKLNVFGAALFGSPAVNVGFTNGVAWSHAVSAARRFTLYELKLARGRPTRYVLDGRERELERQTVRVPVSGSRTERHTFYRSRWGFVLSQPANGIAWTEGTAYSIADANAANARIIDTFYEMNQAQSVRELERAQERAQGIPWVFTIAADARGRVYYGDASVVPHVTRDKVRRCVNSPLGQIALTTLNLPVLDGSTTRCAWGSDRDAVQRGTFGPRRWPQLHRDDYVANGSDSHWLLHPAKPLEGFPEIWGPERTARSLRTRLVHLQLQQRLAGADGLPGNRFTLPLLQEVMFANRNHSAELARDAVVQRCQASPSVALADGRVVDLGEACAVLAGWDLRADLGSRGAVLWREFWMRFLNAVPADADRWRVQFDPSDPLGTPNVLNVDDPRVMQSLGAAVQAMRDAGVPLDVPLGEVQSEPRPSGPIPIPGCRGSEGCFNALEPSDLGVANYRDIRGGGTFVVAVAFEDGGPVARAILPYSQSDDLGSPHSADQTRLFSQEGWLPMRFAEHEIRRDPAYSRRVVNGRD